MWKFSQEYEVNIIWIGQDIYTPQNQFYFNNLNQIINNNNINNRTSFESFANVQEAMEKIKRIKFKATIIILSGDLCIDFITQFCNNMKDIFIIPNIIIFTNDPMKYDQIIKTKFFKNGGIKASFQDVVNFIIDQIKNIIHFENPIQKTESTFDHGGYLFEYIDCKEKLLLPLFYKSLIDNTSTYNNEKFTSYLYKKYSYLGGLIKSFVSIKDIPIELLSKFYARTYTYENENDKNNSFYKKLNNDLRNNKNDFYLPYIKTLYKGVELESLKLAKLASNEFLYRGSKLKKEEINYIYENKNKKIPGLPSSIIFSKVFLSFSRKLDVAKNFIPKDVNDDEVRVLFKLKKDDNIDYSLSTHADLYIDKISYFDNEEEVLFFPFSSFEIDNISLNYNIYYIDLLYLGKYLKEFKNDEKFIRKEEIILPDSKFKQEIVQSNLVKPEKINNVTNKNIIKTYEKYKINIEKEKQNKIKEYIEPEKLKENNLIIDNQPDQSKKIESNLEVNQPGKSEEKKDMTNKASLLKNEKIVHNENICCKYKKYIIFSFIILVLIAAIIIIILLRRKKSGDDPPINPQDNNTELYSDIITTPTQSTDIFPTYIPSTNIIIPQTSIIIPTTIINRPINITYKCLEDQCFDINYNKIDVGLQWKYELNNYYDLDISLSGFDKNNSYNESIYFGKLTGLNGSVNHTKDDFSGNQYGETISIDLRLMPSFIQSLAIIINSYNNKSLTKATEPFLNIYEKDSNSKTLLKRYMLNYTKDDNGLLFGLIERNNQNNGWLFRLMKEPYEGKAIVFYYLSIVKFLGDFSEKNIYPIPDEQIYATGDLIQIDEPIIYIGLGWENYPRIIYDLDFSIISFDKNNNFLEVIYFNNLKSSDGLINHFGDNRVGNGEGEDETISINLINLNQNVNSLALIINNYKGYNMDELKSCFIKFYDDNSIIGFYFLEKGIKAPGLLIGFLKRNNLNSYWSFKIQSSSLFEINPQKSVEQVKNILVKGN